ncbi:hypothetical protein M378DRAFT_172908, partial [Amanita muscaria Koide BX008]
MSENRAALQGAFTWSVGRCLRTACPSSMLDIFSIPSICIYKFTCTFSDFPDVGPSSVSRI